MHLVRFLNENTIVRSVRTSRISDQISINNSEVACHLIHQDFRDEASQTEEEEWRISPNDDDHENDDQISINPVVKNQDIDDQSRISPYYIDDDDDYNNEDDQRICPDKDDEDHDHNQPRINPTVKNQDDDEEEYDQRRISPVLKNQEAQTDLSEFDLIGNYEGKSDETLQQSNLAMSSCPNIHLEFSRGEDLEEVKKDEEVLEILDFNGDDEGDPDDEDNFNLDFSQLKYCLETAIVDDFVVL